MISNYFDNFNFGQYVKISLDLRFNHFRFKLQNGNFRRIEDKIYTISNLINILKRFKPLDAYYTPVKWLDPVKVGKTKSEMDVMLSSPLFFDLDFEPDQMIESSNKQGNMLIKHLYKKFVIKPDKIVFSGSKGIHIYYDNFDQEKIMEYHPRDRIEYFIDSRKSILEDLKNVNIMVDSTVTADPYRLMRIPGTINSKSNKMCLEIQNLDQLLEQNFLANIDLHNLIK